MPDAEFTNDDNGDVLRRMAANGDDLDRPRDIDFIVVLPDEPSAQRFAMKARGWGYETTARQAAVEPSLPWDVCVVKHMVPSHAGISEFERMLERESAPFGGRNDSWGCFEQK